ncbi:MAG: ABC transporter permease [Lachnospiraceae bacterium]|nr:ABC transporter permease [Lachnospiraceae bacterium]
MSILLIIAAGVGFFVGVKATAPSMYLTANTYFNDQKMMDMEILSTVGFSDDDVEEIKKLDHVSRVVPSYSVDLIFKEGENSDVIKVLACPDENDGINIPLLRSGRMPQYHNECVVVENDAIDEIYEIGKVIRFDENSSEEELSSILLEDTFEVVGVVELPQYFSYNFGTSSIGNGEISNVILIPEENFEYSRYTEMYLTVDCAENGIDSFSDEYTSIVSELSKKLESLGEVQYKAFLDESEQQIKDAESEYNEGKKDADTQLEDAKKELEDAKTQIEDGYKQLAEGKEEYDSASKSAKEQISSAERQIQEGKSQLADGETQLAQGYADYEEGRHEADTQLGSARTELDSGWSEYYSGQAEYDAAYDEYKDAIQTYEDGQREYESAQAEYDEKLNTFNALDEGLSALEAELAYFENASFIINNEEISIAEDALRQTENALADAEAELATLDPESDEYSALLSTIDYLNGEIDYYSTRIDELNQSGSATSDDLKMEVQRYRAQLDESKYELDLAEIQLADAKIQLEEGKAQLDEASDDLASAESQLQDGLSQLESSEQEYQVESEKASSQLEDARIQLEESERKIADSRKELGDAEVQLSQEKTRAEKELSEAAEKISDSEVQLADAEKEYQEGIREYEDAVAEVEEELSSGMHRIQNARNDFNEIVAGKWYVLTRDDIVVNYSNFKNDAMRINAIADVFPVFFLLVAALVCLTTMSRMVDEQRTQMGTYKALGYTPAQIIMKYVIYAVIASIIGSIIGPILCVQVLPKVILNAYSRLYALPDIMLTVPYDMYAISVVVALACTALVAIIACNKELKTTTASLMRPKSPKAGKKIFLENITPLWNHFSFFQKLTARNLLRYKVRFFMTVIGIAGCMALVVAGFGLNNAISPMLSLQYNEIEHDDVVVTLDKNYTYDEIDGLVDCLRNDGRIDTCLLNYKNSCKVYDKDELNAMEDTYVLVPQNETDSSVIFTFRDPKTKEGLTLGDDGAIITDKLSRKLGLNIGDDMVVKIGEDKYSMKVGGVAENYLNNYVYLSPEYYEKVTGGEIKYNSILARESETMTDRDRFSSEMLSDNEEIILIYFTDSVKNTVDETMKSMKMVVVVMIICAGILAFIVLFNLTNINLSERVREIATVKVLGFNHSETNMLIFRENFVMSVIGVLVGCVLGYFMAQYLISTVEVNMVTFVRDVSFTCYLYSAVITLGFTIIVNLFMTRKIRDISMVESLKAIE